MALKNGGRTIASDSNITTGHLQRFEKGVVKAYFGAEDRLCHGLINTVSIELGFLKIEYHGMTDVSLPDRLR